MSAATKRVLPADVFDALELSAMAFGGIGAYYTNRDAAPHCVFGHAAFASGVPAMFSQEGAGTEVGHALCVAGISALNNDDAVAAILARTHRRRDTGKATFAEWCAELGVVRGES